MARDNRVYVLGCGGHAKVVISTLLQLGLQVDTVFDDNPDTWDSTLCRRPITGPIPRVSEFPNLPAVIAVGNNQVRQKLDSELNLDWLTAVHPHAFVDPSATLSPGTVVFAGAVVQPDTMIGRHVIVNTGSSIDHDCQIEDYVHIAPGARLAGDVTVGHGTLLGIGSAVVPGRKIGANSIIGAGAAVIDDIPANAVAVGVPARIHNTRTG